MEAKKKKRIVISSIIAAIAVVLLIVFFAIGGKKHGHYHIETRPATLDSLETTITATGEIQPVTKVEVGTQVSGKVEKLYVDYNSHVTKGQLLAELDRSTLLERINQCQANLASAQSSLNQAKLSYERIKALYQQGAETQENLENAENQYNQAKSQVELSKTSLRSAEVDLSYATITSPIDGIVMSKSVEEGQTVASSFSTPTIFTIAQDLTRMQVEANVDEADIGKVVEGQKVTFTVDAYPDDVFTGTVRQKRLSPTVTNNVVTYTVIIDAPNPDEKLMPGMTASVNIIVDKQGGITIPMEALFFKIDEGVKMQLAKQGIELKGLFRTAEEETMALKDISTKTVWVKNGNTYEQRKIKPGISDGANTIILEGLKERDQVVISVKEEVKGGSNKSSKNFMPGPPERKKR
ncbi:MAG: efflux RND transporter periplasmic adaptor subunit [Bacteroidales bacterium]|nr:efflux RND transporter periplasmic adaptor subunit [Bacteroidales bacterium]